MLLSKLLDKIDTKDIISCNFSQKIDYITANSKLIKKNSIFIIDCYKQIKKKYINEAFNNGAVAILTNKKIKNIKYNQIVVKNLTSSSNLILNKLKPFKPKNIIGVTGTNGKTSVVWITSNILKECKYNVKSLGTLGYYKNLKKIKDTSLTTPEKEEIIQFAQSSDSKKTNFVFEVSSHSISKKRISNMYINVGAITNVTQDHLDFHKSFANYKKTKFNFLLKNLANNGTAIINENIKGIKNLEKKLKKRNIKTITYGKNNSNVNCYNLNKKTRIKIYSKFYNVEEWSNYKFELENLSCSICNCLAIGIKTEDILNSLSNLTKPPGRLELVGNCYNGSKIFVDYAHTPSALKNILISGIKDGIKPSLVFGCGGDRDKQKRIIMGKIANNYADSVYVTDDNPRNEDPKQIRKAILNNCSKAKEIPDRKKAIEEGIKNLSNNSILIIAGKGHEKKQYYKNKSIIFDDSKIVKLFIGEVNLNFKKIEKYLINNSNKIKFNTNDINKGDVFVTLQGKNYHGSNFIEEALKKGCKYIISDKKSNLNKSKKIFFVNNCISILEQIALKKRKLFKGKTIGITGSVGKTTTKEYLNFFLSKSLQKNISSSIKSYNNHLGILISIINMNLNSKFSIFEVGTNNFGEIRKLASIVLPDQVIITNIFPTHLNNFKNTKNIAIEKSGLFDQTCNPNIELLVLPNSNKDELYLQKIAKKRKIKKIITFGENKKSDYYYKYNNKENKISYFASNKKINLNNFSSANHNLYNLNIPLIILNHNNIPIGNFISNIYKIPTVIGRGSHHYINLNNFSVKIINESYNASPASMYNCMNYFKEINSKTINNKILILGEMLELGRKTLKFHKEIAIEAIKKEFDIIIFCGPKYKEILSKIQLSLKNVFYFSNEKHIINFLNNKIQKNDIILAKGSNSSKINKLVNYLLKYEIKRKINC